MSIFYCISCGRTKDSDYTEYETIDGYDICIDCLDSSDAYEYCETCDTFFDVERHGECPNTSCRIQAARIYPSEHEYDDGGNE